MTEYGRFKQVRIERYAELLDTSGLVIQDPNTGEVARDWVEVATVWATIEPLSVREFIQSQEKQSQVSAKIKMRFRDDFDAACRLIHVRVGQPEIIYNPLGILADKDSGLEYLTVPVSAGVSSTGQ
jgi:SPP1 family predicted phage head-tail adaptor